MKLHDTGLPEVKLIEPRVFSDNRGFFFENWNAGRYAKSGIPNSFVQDNLSFSTRNVVRGLHFQHPKDQGKLVSVLHGEIFDVVVDIRLNSPRYKRWAGFNLSEQNHLQLWLPEGFAHGFAVLSPTAVVCYKTTEYYSPETEQTLLWNDPELNITWPVNNPIISPKDLEGKLLSDFPADKLPKY